MNWKILLAILILVLAVCPGYAQQAAKPAPVATAAAAPQTPNGERIADLQSALKDVIAEIDRLTIVKHQIEGGIIELQRLDNLAAGKTKAEKNAPAAATKPDEKNAPAPAPAQDSKLKVDGPAPISKK